MADEANEESYLCESNETDLSREEEEENVESSDESVEDEPGVIEIIENTEEICKDETTDDDELRSELQKVIK